MRVSPVGWAFPTLEETLAEAARSAECTHNHPEGVKGAQAVTATIFLARSGYEKSEIREYTETRFGYDLSRSLADIRKGYAFDETCRGTVPEALTAFLESRSFTHAVQCAISLGGDSDTLAAIAGSVAEAYYDKIPQDLLDFMEGKITGDMQALIGAFHRRIQWRLDEPAHPYTLREFAEKIGRPSKPSYKRRQRLCACYAGLVEAESRGALTPEEREELARIQERIVEAEEKARNRLSKRMSLRGRGGRE